MAETKGVHVPSWGLARYQQYGVPCLFLFVVGCAMASVLPDFPCFHGSVIAWLTLVCLGLVLWRWDRWIIRGAVWLLVFLVGGVYFQTVSFQPSDRDISQFGTRQQLTVKGVLASRDVARNRAVLEVTRANNQSADGKVQLYSSKDVGFPEVGTTVEVVGNLKPPWHALVPGAFDQRGYLRSKGITAVMTKTSVEQVLTDVPIPFYYEILKRVAGVRDQISGVFSHSLTSPGAEILGGVVLGHHAVPIDKETKGQFIRTGTIHFLAASGLNVGIIAGFMMLLTQRILPVLRLRLLLAMAAVLIYVLLAGLSPSVVRAGAMLELALVLKLLDKELSHLSLLAAAAFVMTIFSPDVVTSLSFQFSVLTTFGLIVWVPPLQQWLGYYMTRWASGVLLVPLVAQLWVLPLSMYHFNQFPVHSVLLNVVAIVMVVPLTAIGFTAGALSLVWEPLGHWLSYLAWPFLQGLLFLIHIGDAMKWAQWTVASPPPWLVLAMYLFLLLVAFLISANLRWSGTRKWMTAMTAVLLMLIPLGWQRVVSEHQTSFHIIPLSAHRVAFALQPNGTDQTVLVVPFNIGYWEGRALQDYLRHGGIRKVAALAWLPATRFGKGVDALLKKIDVDAFIYLDVETPELKTFIKPQLLGAGGVFRLGDVAVQSLYPGHVRLQADEICLETVNSNKSSDCLVRWVTSKNQPYRLELSDKNLSLKNSQYYRGILEDQKLTWRTDF